MCSLVFCFQYLVLSVILCANLVNLYSYTHIHEMIWYNYSIAYFNVTFLHKAGSIQKTQKLKWLHGHLVQFFLFFGIPNIVQWCPCSIPGQPRGQGGVVGSIDTCVLYFPQSLGVKYNPKVFLKLLLLQEPGDAPNILRSYEIRR